ncbi:MAG: sulfatase-like hydrolase/transferase [Phycisphaerales bacterium]|nr:MAG: sulfatase-like hydrolase/transferase [Phycisphaerales bacterium]
MKHSWDRRNFLKAAGVVAAAPMGSTWSRARTAQATRPNILIIHTDEHRIECLGAYGNADVKTPNIDRLAAEGVRYDTSFCPFPVCTPSRYSLLCGQYVHEHRGWSNHCTLAPAIATFPKVLRTEGYRTKAVGKMHFTPTYLDVGFSEMTLAEQNGPGRWDDDYHRYLREHGLVDRNDLEDQLVREYRAHAPQEYWDTCGARVSNLPEEHHSTTWTADRAVETLQGWSAAEPNLLMVGFIKPHHPFDPPAPWDQLYDPEKLTLLPGWTPQCLDRDFKYNRGYFPNDKLTEPTLRRVMAFYYATITQIDHHVGRMIEVLKRKGLYDSTLIVFTSDHGDYMGFHHMLLKGNYMYDPVVKVPLIVKWPGSREAGTVSQRLVNNIDLAPTLCRVAGCEAPASMYGHALQDAEGHELIFAEARGGRDVMARSQTRKLILTGGDNENLFFDLEKDPQELNNRYGAPAYRAEIKAMEAQLTAWRCKESKPKPYLDQGAPQIDQPNVPPHDLSHREAIQRYYREKMMALQKRV